MVSKKYKVIRIDVDNYNYIIKLLKYNDSLNDGITQLIRYHREQQKIITDYTHKSENEKQQSK